jgi:hypothetical protein
MLMTALLDSPSSIPRYLTGGSLKAAQGVLAIKRSIKKINIVLRHIVSLPVRIVFLESCRCMKTGSYKNIFEQETIVNVTGKTAGLLCKNVIVSATFVFPP